MRQDWPNSSWPGRSALIVSDQKLTFTSFQCSALPVFQAYYQLLDEHFQAYIAWHCATLKLCHILVAVVMTLAQQGFCKPPHHEEQAGGNAEVGEGVGMGTGKGDKNVSKEIEGEEQVEGLENEADIDEKGDAPDGTNEKDDYVDMSEDFGGRTENLSQEEDDYDEQQDKEGDDNEDVQEELGNVDPLDPMAVDDKFWQGNEKEDEVASSTGEQTSQQLQNAAESGIGGREDQRQEPDKENQVQASENIEDLTQKLVESDKVEDVGDGDNIEEGQHGEVNTELETQEIPDLDTEAQALDLPNDLEMDAPPKEPHYGSEDEIESSMGNEGRTPEPIP